MTAPAIPINPKWCKECQEIFGGKYKVCPQCKSSTSLVNASALILDQMRRLRDYENRR